MVAVAQRVHRLPEAVVAIAGELAVTRERAHRTLLPDGLSTFQVAADAGREHEEPAVGPAAVPARLLLELPHTLAVDVQRAEAARRLHRRHGGGRSLRAGEWDERGDVAVLEVRNIK